MSEPVVSELASWLVFIETHIVSLIFSVLFFCFLVFLLKLNFGNAEYQNFRIAQMISRADGSLDRKALERAILFLVSIYGFIHVMHKVPEQLTTYFFAMAGVWLTAHVAANKLPDRAGPPEPKQ